MQLFVIPGACSFASHVTLYELAIGADIICVSPNDPNSRLRAVNPLGRVPSLQLDDETVLTENTAILPYLADLKPGTPLFAPAGSIERAQIQSWIGYLNSEVHAGCFRAINRPYRYIDDPEHHIHVREKGLALLAETLIPIVNHLENRRWLVGERFTIADAYFGVFCSWLQRIGEPFTTHYPRLNQYHTAYEARASVKQARLIEQQR